MTRPSPTFDPAPTELDEVLDLDWLTTALADVGPDERVVRVDQVGHSATLAQKVRFAADIEGSDGGRRTRTYCLKAHFGDGSPETLLTETHVYRELRPVVDIRSPHAHYTGIDEAKGRSLIIMDDVESSGGRFLSAHEPYSVATCRDALGQLAQLHAATWDEPRWAVDWLDPRMVMTSGLFSTDALQGLLDDGRGAGIAPTLLDAGQLKEAVAVAASLPATCVIHGDTHSGNVYLDADGRACWLDWQVTQRGHWSIDVSYHLATALDVEDRRDHEEELLRGYLAELARLGVEPPSWADAWERYTLGFVWGYLLWSITRISSREVVLIHFPRLAAALADHDTFSRLGVARA